MNTPTHTLNSNTGREITINGVRFWNLLKHGFKYDEEFNQLYDKPLPPDTPKYVSKSRWSRQTIVQWSLEVRHTTSCSVTTIDHKVENGWRWVRKKPKCAIMSWTLARYLPLSRTTARTTATTQTISMNSRTTKMVMHSSHSRSDIPWN